MSVVVAVDQDALSVGHPIGARPLDRQRVCPVEIEALGGMERDAR